MSQRALPHAAPSPDDAALWRNVGKWSAGFALFFALAALLVTLQLFQATAEGNAKRTLRRSLIAVTEIDALLARDYDELQERARTVEPGETVELTDYPIDVPLTREEALGATPQQTRNLILDRSAALMYDRGSGVLRDEEASGADLGTFTAAGMTDRMLGFLRSRTHDILGVLTFALAALCAVLALTLVALSRGFGRLVSLGVVVLVAAVPLALGGVGARFYMRIAADGDTEYLQRELLKIGQGLTWIPIRNGIAFTVLGSVFLLVGIVCARWADRTRSTDGDTGQYA